MLFLSQVTQNEYLRIILFVQLYFKHLMHILDQENISFLCSRRQTSKLADGLRSRLPVDIGNNDGIANTLRWFRKAVARL